VQLVNQLQARVAEVRKRVAGLPRPRVVCLEWIEPPFAMGNWGPELVELAGGESLLGAVGAHSTTTPWQAVLETDPDVLIITPCGFSLARAEQEMHRIASLPGYAKLAAARADRVFVADGNLYFNRSSPSLFDTPEILAEMLHPQAFAPRRESTAWRRFLAG
jgi:iron complex transport system substrate-binding protein